jgi:hypothetical protein
MSAAAARTLMMRFIIHLLSLDSTMTSSNEAVKGAFCLGAVCLYSPTFRERGFPETQRAKKEPGLLDPGPGQPC